MIWLEKTTFPFGARLMSTGPTVGAGDGLGVDSGGILGSRPADGVVEALGGGIAAANASDEAAVAAGPPAEAMATHAG